MVVTFFFFQAEDGIRDIGVTGVQTCALPIWRRRSRTTGASQVPGTRVREFTFARGCLRDREDDLPELRPCLEPLVRRSRSEERRVGKEWRYRGAGQHCRDDCAEGSAA